MFPFGHVGLTLALVELARRFPALARLDRLPWPALVVGAMLPDLIDKPLGHVILDWGSGRLFAHTLAFGLAMTALAALASRTRRGGAAAALALGTWTHLAFDSMWNAPAVLLWPALGPMPHGDFEPSGWIGILLTSRFVQATEALGALALAWSALAEGRRRRSARRVHVAARGRARAFPPPR